MRAHGRPQAGISLFPEEMRSSLHGSLWRLCGMVMIVLSGLLMLALMTWKADDPSLNSATNAPVHNLLGRAGAIAADLTMQLIGVSSVIFVAIIAIWGWRLATSRPLDRQGLRAAGWIFAIFCLATAAACWPAAKSWPLPRGLGGLAGDGGLWLVSALFGPLQSFGRLTTGVLAAGLGCLAFALAVGLIPREPDDERRLVRKIDDYVDDADAASISLGAITHWALSLKTKWQRLRLSSAEKARQAALERSLDDVPTDESWVPPRRAARVVLPEAPDDVADFLPGDERREPTFTARHSDDLPHAPRTRHVLPAHMHNVPAPSVAPADAADDTPPFAPDRARQPAARGTPKAARRTNTMQGELPLEPAPGDYQLPSLELLAEVKPSERHASLAAEVLQDNARLLEGVLDDFGVRGEIIQVRPGPVVTLYELEPAPGIKSSRVIGLADDIARSMSAVSARVAVVPGRNAIGIEMPNQKRESVMLREMLQSGDFRNAQEKLAIALGKTIGGEPVIADLAKMPHLLVAGTTGSGKSVAINTMILSLLYRLRPDQCRLIMVDPKMLELSIYDGIPHLLTPVVTDPKKAVVALKWAVREMEERYRKMSKVGVRNIDGFNARVSQATAKGESFARTVQTGFDKETGEPIFEQEEMDLKPLPYIVVIVDEMADLMMVAGKDIEGAIQRLAQMARAAGIHLIMATQRPSVDVITGTIKANFPTRISFQVTSKIDSRTILGEQGAEQLLGRGDMLYMAGGGRIARVHGPFVSDEEVERIVAHLKMQGSPDYLDAVTTEEAEGEGEDGAVFDKGGGGFGDEPTDLYEKAVQVVLRDKKASTSYVQRRLQIGYNRAASLIERMEREGIVGQANHAGKREILVGEDVDH